MSRQFTKPTLIVVEGPDDEAFFSYIAKDREDIEVYNHGGGGDLGAAFRALGDVPGFAEAQRVVIVHDADKGHEASLQKVWTHLINAWSKDASQEGNPVTWDARTILRRLPEDEWVAGPEDRRWKVWILPGDGPGDLESLIWEATTHEPTKRCVDEMLGCLGADSRHRVPTKARLMAYLAVQPDPVPWIGRVVKVSTEKSGIDLRHPALDPLRRRIAEL